MDTNIANRRLTSTRCVLYSLVVTAVLLGGTEAGLRIWANYFRLAYLTYDTVHERPALVPNARVNTKAERVAINSKGFVGPEFEARKQAGTIRIIALGDSCTFSGGWSDNTYPGMLATLLNSHTNARFEVINAGIPGFNSEFALARLREELLHYQPDMVTVYVGWNNLMKVNPTVASGGTRFGTLWKLLNRSYVVKAYSKLIFFYLLPLVVKPEVNENPEGAHAFDDFVPHELQENLDAIAVTLEDNNVLAVFVTLPTVVRLNMTHEDLDRTHVFFPYFAGAYSLEKFLSLHQAYNRVIKQVAGQHHIPLVDLDAIFNEHSKDELFEDTMHPNVLGNRLIAESLVGPISNAFMDRTVAHGSGGESHS